MANTDVRTIMRGLIDNNLHVDPHAITFAIPETKIEDCIMKFLEQSLDNVDGLTVKVVDVNRCKNNRRLAPLAEIAKRYKMSFVPILFNDLKRTGYTSNGIRPEVMGQIRKNVPNFSDNAQIVIAEDQQLNEAVGKLGYAYKVVDGKPVIKWNIIKGKKRCYIGLNPAKCLLMFFKIPLNLKDNFIFDNIETYTRGIGSQKETIYHIGITPNIKAKKAYNIMDDFK